MNKTLNAYCMILALSLFTPGLHARQDARGPIPEKSARRVAVVTFVSSHEQERAVRALIRSVRELGGAYRDSRIFVVTSDAGELACPSLKGEGVEVLPLEMDPAFLGYPLALKAFAASQVERRACHDAETLVWLDPGVIVLGFLRDLDLGDAHDVAVRPVTLANTIAIPPQAPANDYWRPIHEATRLDYRKLPALTTVADGQSIQPYFNCEVFAFNPRLGLARKWARLLARFLKDEGYQKNVCTTFLRRLFLHQAIFSAVIASRVKAERIRPLPLTSAYPFNQHDRLPASVKVAALNDLSVVIFDDAWERLPGWMGRLRIEEPLKEWLAQAYLQYMEIAPSIYRVEGSCNSYLVLTSAGSVLIDPAGAAVAPEFFERLIREQPLRAILLTHGHRDHSDDAGRWRGSAGVPVVAQREYQKFWKYADGLRDFFSRKNAIWAGKLPGEAQEEPRQPAPGPTVFYADAHDLEIGGLHFHSRHLPGETPDHAVIWVPELKAAFVGDNYYEYFINNSTFRGTMVRPVTGYIQAIEAALAHDPDYWLPGHGAPLVSRKEVTQRAGLFLEALKHVHDETVKGINAGKDVYTLMREVKLPEKFAIPQYFGKVEWTVRGIWQEYVGWFDENPASMYAQPLADLYPDLTALAGEDRLLEKARQYLGQKEYVKVLWLTEIVLKADPRAREVSRTRLQALQELRAGTRNFIEKLWLDHAIRLCEESLKQQSR